MAPCCQPATWDFPLPLSTGNPLFDAALSNKLQVTATLNEAEHLNRAWQLVRTAAHADIATLAEHRHGLLNDFKMLLALRSWNDDDQATTRQFLDALPWHWRLAFPIAVLKPAAHFFTGWRKDTHDFGWSPSLATPNFGRCSPTCSTALPR